MEFKPPKKLAHRSVKKVDALITGIILWGIVASIYGLEKHRKSQNDAETSVSECPKPPSCEGKLDLREILKMLVFGVPKEKPSLYRRILQKIGIDKHR